MSVRRRPTTRSLKNKKQGKWKFILIGLLLALLFLFHFFFIKTKFWDGKTKLSVAYPLEGGDVQVTVFDPVNGEIANILIPGNTEVEVSRRLGVWKLRSVWELGRNEDLGGKLLVETLAKNFRIPVYAWSEEGAMKLLNPGFKSVLNLLSGTYETNLSVGDRLRLMLFSLQTPGAKRADLDLSESIFLKMGTLKDGEVGYTLTDMESNRVLSYFSYTPTDDGMVTILIKDGTGEYGVAQSVGALVETIGGKIAAIQKEEPRDFDCSVIGDAEAIVSAVAKVYSCEIGKNKESGFNVEVSLGRKFTERF